MMRLSITSICLAMAATMGLSAAEAEKQAPTSVFGPVIEVSEGRLKRHRFKSYFLDAAPVTNEAFRVFARATKFKTDAERFGWSFVLRDVIPERILKTINETLPNAPWWVPVPGAWWREPEGPGTTVKGRLDFPVTHVSLEDAAAFCRWRGGKLPTSSQWEFAARAGDAKAVYPWGNDASQATKRANLWTGAFPDTNTKEDGHVGLAAAREFGPQNDWGFYNMLGNGWEWTRTKYSGKDVNPEQKNQHWSLHGGSFIDTIDGSANHKATVETVMGNTADAGSNNLCFRCAYKLPPDDVEVAYLARDDEAGIGRSDEL